MIYFVDRELNIVRFFEINNHLDKDGHFKYLGCFNTKQDAELFVRAKEDEKEKSNK